MPNYDVFISSKSEDYSYAEEVYRFLVSKGLKVFLSCMELDHLAEAEYSEAIDEALDNSANMIVIATNANYLTTKWVKYEWRLFCDDLKSGFRNGNVITILDSSIKLGKLPASLRHKQSFSFSSYKEHIIPYVSKEQDLVEVSELYQKGSEYYLGKDGTPRNSKEAISWLLRAARRGHAEAQDLVGWCYCLGDGVDRDLEKAENWFSKAADQGNLNAQGILSLIRQKKENIGNE
ncbi:MAG: toll/interleukin-1 receptor domain-containing protein [Prevotella sp.]|nr:toll/interleukin-1 receptor domain-containing protein [Prevotella sp.]